MPLRRRGDTRALADVPMMPDEASTAIAEIPLDEVLGDGEHFLLNHREALQTSIHTWREVSEVFEPFNDGRVAEELSEFYVDHIHRMGDLTEATKASQVQIIRPRLNKLPGDLAGYLLVYAHARSSSGTFPSSPKQLVKETQTSSRKVDDGLKYLLTDAGYGETVLSLPGMMSEARGIRKHVVNDLVLNARHNPGIFGQLSELSKTKPECRKILGELRKICAIDLHSDPEMSMLRAYIRDMEEDNNAFMEDFVRTVSQTESDAKNGTERLARIKSMAEFALAAQGIDIKSQHDIYAVLAASRDQWYNFADIESTYQEFKRRNIKYVERSLDTFAGPVHAALLDVRYPRTYDDFMATRELFDSYFDPARKTKRTRTAELRVRASLPTGPQIVKEAAVSREEVKGTLVPAIIKKIASGYMLDEVDMDQLLKPMNGDQTMRREMEMAILSLLEDPLGRGTRRLLSESAGLMVGQTKFKMRRFAPRDRPNLSTQSIDVWRIIYGISHTHVGVFQIKPHNRYDQKK